jgi:hypothetical protein
MYLSCSYFEIVAQTLCECNCINYLHAHYSCYWYFYKSSSIFLRAPPSKMAFLFFENFAKVGLEAVTTVAVKILSCLTLIHVVWLKFKGIFSYKCFLHVQGSETRVSFETSVNFHQNSCFTLKYVFSISNILNSRTQICTWKIRSTKYSSSFRAQNPACHFHVLIVRYITEVV